VRQIIRMGRKRDNLNRFENLQKKVNLTHFKSAPNLGAGSSSLFEEYFQSTGTVSSILAAVRLLSPHEWCLRVVASLVFQHGLRISEILNIKGIHIYPNDKLMIHGLKRSKNRLIHMGDVAVYLNRYRGSSSYVFEAYNYDYFYREFKKRGWYISVSSSSKLAVTHSGRHLLAQSMTVEGLEIEDLQEYIGHRNINTTKRYARGKLRKG
jgi:site-specific recombinase XerD